MAGGKIFISYRRADSQWAAARLYDTLSAAFPEERIFMDVEKIAPGQDFIEVLAGQVGVCDVFLALIGPEWLSLRSPGGARRLDDAKDFVRIEIASALGREGTVTIPILLDGAAPPRPPICRTTCARSRGASSSVLPMKGSATRSAALRMRFALLSAPGRRAAPRPGPAAICAARR